MSDRLAVSITVGSVFLLALGWAIVREVDYRIRDHKILRRQRRRKGWL